MMTKNQHVKIINIALLLFISILLLKVVENMKYVIFVNIHVFNVGNLRLHVQNVKTIYYYIKMHV